MNRIITAAREGWQAALRVWDAYGRAEGRARAQQIRLASMTNAELLKASTKWSGAICAAELHRRGLQ
jgi:hypothetical protein